MRKILYLLLLIAPIMVYTASIDINVDLKTAEQIIAMRNELEGAFSRYGAEFVPGTNRLWLDNPLLGTAENVARERKISALIKIYDKYDRLGLFAMLRKQGFDINFAALHQAIRNDITIINNTSKIEAPLFQYADVVKDVIKSTQNTPSGTIIAVKINTPSKSNSRGGFISLKNNRTQKPKRIPGLRYPSRPPKVVKSPTQPLPALRLPRIFPPKVSVSIVGGISTLLDAKSTICQGILDEVINASKALDEKISMMEEACGEAEKISMDNTQQKNTIRDLKIAEIRSLENEITQIQNERSGKSVPSSSDDVILEIDLKLYRIAALQARINALKEDLHGFPAFDERDNQALDKKLDCAAKKTAVNGDIARINGQIDYLNKKCNSSMDYIKSMIGIF